MYQKDQTGIQYPAVGGATTASPNKVLQNTLADGTAGLGVVGGIGYTDALLAQKASMSPLQSALNEQGEQLDKLHSLLMELTNRLKPVLVGDGSAICAREATPEPMRSAHTHQVVRQAEAVQDMQICVRTLMEELEV
jgi:uncharacterized coiled-coil protein SlyX